MRKMFETLSSIPFGIIIHHQGRNYLEKTDRMTTEKETCISFLYVARRKCLH